MCKRGELSSFRLGKLIRIPANEVERIECQNIDSSGIEDNSASPTPTPFGDELELRLARMTEGQRRLSLVRSGEPAPARHPNG